MNKDIKFILVDSALESTLNKALNEDKNNPSSKQLLEALESLKENKTNSIILEKDNNESSYNNDGTIISKDLQIHLKSRRVLLNNKEILLTPKEFDILYFLAENRGEVFTKEQIYKAVWSAEYILDDSNIMAFIRKLRRKIEPNPDEPIYILTIWGIGYMFTDKI